MKTIAKIICMAMFTGFLWTTKVNAAQNKIIVCKNKTDVVFENRDEVVYATYNINIRKQPSLDAEIVGLLVGNKDIKRIGYSEKWSKVVFQDKEMYVASEYLTTNEPEIHASDEVESTDLVYLGKFKITAYCGGACCNGKWAGTTSTGVVPSDGKTIAVAPWMIPYGSTVYIDGVGCRVAEDTGGFANRNDYQIDLYMSSHDATNSWGVQYKDVWIER